jgi:hypothetical protein
MRLDKTHITCAICQAPLKALEVQTCTRCGKPICGRHVQLQRKAYSRVLTSVCANCNPQGVAPLPTTPASFPPSPLHIGTHIAGGAPRQNKKGIFHSHA